MKVKLILSAISLFVASYISAQAQDPTQNPFNEFAKKQSVLIQESYNKRDAQEGLKLMTLLMDKYNQLNSDNKSIFRGYVTNNWYNLSCLYALINRKKESYAALDSAIKYGYANYNNLKADSDFENFKNDEEFKRLVTKVRSVGDYKYILQRAEKYNANDKRKLPDFTYKNTNDAHLDILRKTFKLDSVAGTGDDASKAINILKWVHNTVKHDGQHESGINKINAANIISSATEKHIGVSCGELATTLNECYLAMGWKSRKVYCLPKDSLKIDYDSHVINAVFLPDLKKWVWMDPTNNAYVKDENNTLLSIAEVRERIIKSKPLFINDDANWNNKVKVTKQDYLDRYMAKNLYRMYSPLSSEYDYETRDNNKTITYISLLPLDYYSQSPDKSEDKNATTNVMVVRYKTNNDSVFWSVGH